MADSANKISYKCGFCKQLNLKKPFACSTYGRFFHKSCLKGNHKIIVEGEIKVCSGNLVVNPDITDNMSICSTDSGQLKRNRAERFTEDDEEMVDKTDIILSGMTEVDLNNEDRVNDLKKFIVDEMRNFRREVVSTVRHMVRKEIAAVNHVEASAIGKVKVNSDGELYSQKVKKSNMENIIFEPKSNQDGISTWTELKSKVNVGKLDLGGDSVKKMQSDNVVIGCAKKSTSEVLIKELKNNMGPNFNIKLSEKKLPKVKILDIEEEVMSMEKDNEIIDFICTQNDIVIQETTNMVIKRGMKGIKGYGFIIIEVDPKTHKILLDNQRIKLGWSKCTHRKV